MRLTSIRESKKFVRKTFAKYGVWLIQVTVCKICLELLKLFDGTMEI
jgi:hypothetical protein